MKTLRKVLIFAVAVTKLFAAEVYVTAHGKTYHTNKQCMSLARANTVLSADDKEAIQHGLHECGICARATKNKPTTKANNTAWAKQSVQAKN